MFYIQVACTPVLLMINKISCSSAGSTNGSQFSRQFCDSWKICKLWHAYVTVRFIGGIHFSCTSSEVLPVSTLSMISASMGG